MAKEYGQLRHDIWADDDWLNLTVPAQHLYMVLLSDPTLNYCGVASWHPGRMAQRSAENTPRDTLLAAAELSDAHFLVFDELTEEVMIRSYLKHDPILKNPRLAVTMAKEFAVIGSRKIRAALVFELQKLKKANPDWPAWEKPGVKTILRQTAVDARSLETDLPMAAQTYFLTGLPSGLPNGLPSGFEKPTPGVYQPPTTSNKQQATSTCNESKDSQPETTESYPQAARLRVVGDESVVIA